MTMTVPQGWPTSHRAGDTLRFDIKKTDFDPSEDVLNVYLSSKDNNYNFQATDNGEFFRVDVPSISTASWQKDNYSLQATITCADNSVFTIHTSNFEVFPNLTIGNADPRSHAMRVLQSIEAVIEGTASSDVMSYEIAGRRLDRYPIKDLLVLRSQYRRECQAENSATNFIKFGFR